MTDEVAPEKALSHDLYSATLNHPFWTAPRPSQQKRYEKIMWATIELASEGGYDAVQMRSVAARSGVSLGTVYTYFQSRDNLLYRATVAWNAGMVEEAARESEKLSRPGIEGIEDDLLRSCERFLAHPGLLDAFVKSTLSTDPVVVELRKQVNWGWWMEHHPKMALLGPEIAELAPRLLTDVFYSKTLRWAFGQLELSEVPDQMRAVIRLLIQASKASTSPALLDPDRPGRQD